MDEIVGQPGIQSHLGDEIVFPVHQVGSGIPGGEFTEIDDFHVRMFLCEAMEGQVESGDGGGKPEIAFRHRRSEDRDQRQCDEYFRWGDPLQEILHFSGIALHFFRKQLPVILDGHLIEPDIPFRLLRDI